MEFKAIEEGLMRFSGGLAALDPGHTFSFPFWSLASRSFGLLRSYFLTRHQEENHGMKGEARTWCVRGVALPPVEVWESLWPQLPLTSGRLTFLHSYLL